MFRLGLSNLQLRSNLLPEDYQGEYQPGMRVMDRITVYEVKDIWERNPMLKDRLTVEQDGQWRGGLFAGATAVSMAQDDRCRAWLERLAENMEKAIDSLEDRADAERAFEVLCVAECLAAPGLESTYAAKAVDWAQRARIVLGHLEFRLTDPMIDERLDQALGDEGWRRTHGQAGAIRAPQAVVRA